MPWGAISPQDFLPLEAPKGIPGCGAAASKHPGSSWDGHLREGHCPVGAVRGFQWQSSVFHVSQLLCSSKQLVLFVLADFLIY